MVSESELVERLREFLRSSDLNTTTTAIVRRRLEEDFGVDLSDRKAFIREQVDLFLQSQLENDRVEEAEEIDAAGDGREGEESNEEEEEEGESEEEATTSNGKNRRKRVSNKLNKENKRKGGGGFTKLCSLSPQLEKFIGVSELSRTGVVKEIWAYIREKNLQNPENKRNILCDEAMRALFGVKSIDMFQMNKVLSKHIWPLASDDAGPDKAEKTIQKEKQRKQEREGPDESLPKEKRRKGATSGTDQKKGGSTGILAPVPLSDALVKFIGTGESALSRADVVKRMWEYIKKNNLQDPSDKRKVICDERLKELLDVDSFNGFTVSKLLSSHFIKTEQ